MIIAGIAVAYGIVYLLAARWFYTAAVKGGHDVTDPREAAFLGAVCLVVALVWPLAALGLLALRFVTRDPKGERE